MRAAHASRSFAALEGLAEAAPPNGSARTTAPNNGRHKGTTASETHGSARPGGRPIATPVVCRELAKTRRPARRRRRTTGRPSDRTATSNWHRRTRHRRSRTRHGARARSSRPQSGRNPHDHSAIPLPTRRRPMNAARSPTGSATWVRDAVAGWDRKAGDGGGCGGGVGRRPRRVRGGRCGADRIDGAGTRGQAGVPDAGIGCPACSRRLARAGMTDGGARASAARRGPDVPIRPYRPPIPPHQAPVPSALAPATHCPTPMVPACSVRRYPGNPVPHKHRDLATRTVTASASPQRVMPPG
jgi:hypothetical protein